MPAGALGEITVRADEPWVLMAGYWRNPEATVEAWRNYWFHTGDAGMYDEDGYFYFVDRIKDTIRRRGENISSMELEAVINDCPHVLESAAVGVPSEYGEEDIKVYVVPGDDSFNATEVMEYLLPRLPRFMMPRFIVAIAELPKTPTEKVRKQLLRDRDDTDRPGTARPPASWCLIDACASEVENPSGAKAGQPSEMDHRARTTLDVVLARTLDVVTHHLLISGGSLIDGTGSPPKPDTAVLLSDGRIAALGAEAITHAPAGVTTIDASGKTVMPGIIDSHVHCTFDDVQSNDELFFHRDPAMVAFTTAQNVQKLLLAGVTSFVDPDGLHGIGPSVRDAIDAGVIEGPRMKTGVQALLTAVGGTAGRLIPDEGTIGYAQVVNSVDDVILWTRRHIKYGADWIKIHATGLIPGRKGEVLVWSRDELKASCDTAHELGIPVMAHCRDPESIKVCAEVGVDLILHASFMDEAGLEAVIEAGAAICPTFTFLANLADFGSKVGATPGMEDIFRGEISVTAKMMRKAFDAGTMLVCGSESGFALTPYGHWHGREMQIFVEELGLSELEAITTSTKNGAWVMRMEDELGTLEVGKLADVLVVDGDPTSDITMLNDKSRLSEVISRGKRIDLVRPWPTHGSIPGWKVSNWASDILTWEQAYR